MTQGEGQGFCAANFRNEDCYSLLEEFAMAELESYPYETRLNILHKPLELIDVDGRTVALKPGQGFVVPKTVVHRTRAPKRATILMVENAGIIPTGN